MWKYNFRKKGNEYDHSAQNHSVRRSLVRLVCEEFLHMTAAAQVIPFQPHVHWH